MMSKNRKELNDLSEMKGVLKCHPEQAGDAKPELVRVWIEFTRDMGKLTRRRQRALVQIERIFYDFK